LFAALVSYLDAKTHAGQWLLRIEDIDPPREQAGASESILRTLEAHGLRWDETETYQSRNYQRYEENLEALRQQNRLFWCNCSRKQLAGQATYPGTCRTVVTPQENAAIRLKTLPETVRFQDLFQNTQQANTQADYGDVILKRRDGLYAYQLAVVSDDIDSCISHVIRGIDLLDSTYWQLELYQALGAVRPVYGHFPVLHKAGSDQKLSKQNLAAAVDDRCAPENLKQALSLMSIDVGLDTPEQMLLEAERLYKRNSLKHLQILHISESALDSK
jgi:glutamyl-Q tRNA(Asp) synthetase